MGLSDWPSVTLLSPSQVQNFGQINQQIQHGRNALPHVPYSWRVEPQEDYWAADTPVRWFSTYLAWQDEHLLSKRSRLNPHLVSALLRHQVSTQGRRERRHVQILRSAFLFSPKWSMVSLQALAIKIRSLAPVERSLEG